MGATLIAPSSDAAVSSFVGGAVDGGGVGWRLQAVGSNKIAQVRNSKNGRRAGCIGMSELYRYQRVSRPSRTAASWASLNADRPALSELSVGNTPDPIHARGAKSDPATYTQAHHHLARAGHFDAVESEAPILRHRDAATSLPDGKFPRGLRRCLTGPSRQLRVACQRHR